MGSHNHGRLWWHRPAYITLGASDDTTRGDEKLWQWAERVGTKEAGKRLNCFPSSIRRAILRGQEMEKRPNPEEVLARELGLVKDPEPEPVPEPTPDPLPSAVGGVFVSRDERMHLCRVLGAVPIELIQIASVELVSPQFAWEQTEDGNHFLHVYPGGAG